MSGIIRPSIVREPNREQIGSLVKRVGIPTLLEGVQFRSRIEATWAAFLTSVKIPWDYEPTDLKWWIPDFKLNFAKHPLLIEVKAEQEDVALAKSKIECSGWEGEVAILINAKTSVVGEMFDPEFGWDRAVMASCLGCQLPTIFQEAGRWQCRSCGAGQSRLWFGWKPLRDWDAAKNVTQWRKPT